MKLTSIITRSATIALATAALAAPAASARPADLPPAPRAAEQQRQDSGSTNPAPYPTRPAQGEQANPRPDTTAAAPAARGIAWTTITIGMAGSLLAIGTIAGRTRRTRRTGRSRITA